MNIAVITGASAGIGRELVYAVDKDAEYDEIWVIARRKERLEELRGKCRNPIRPIALDLSDLNAGQRRRLRRVRPVCRGGSQEAHLECTAQLARTHGHVPREPAVYAFRQQYHQHGLELCLAAGAVSGGLRREQELCSEPFPRARP